MRQESFFKFSFTGTSWTSRSFSFLSFLLAAFVSCGEAPSSQAHKPEPMQEKSASQLLGNPAYTAISYGGYRGLSRSEQPTMDQLKEDMRLLHAMGIRFLRTYNVQLPHASNVVKAIAELKESDPAFEMYVMLGAWIDCEGAWTDAPNHAEQDFEANEAEIQRAVALTQQHPDIIKVIAVGNEAMVHWAASYFVAPGVILGWVNTFRDSSRGELPKELWICSDNFASWGGGAEYYNADLDSLIRAGLRVDAHLSLPRHPLQPDILEGGTSYYCVGNNKTNTHLSAAGAHRSRQTCTSAKPEASVRRLLRSRGSVRQTNSSKPCFTGDAQVDPVFRDQLLLLRGLTTLEKCGQPHRFGKPLCCSREMGRPSARFGPWWRMACSRA